MLFYSCVFVFCYTFLCFVFSFFHFVIFYQSDISLLKIFITDFTILCSTCTIQIAVYNINQMRPIFLPKLNVY